MAYLYELKKTKYTVHHFIVKDDLDNDLFDIAFKELQLENPYMAHQLSRDVITQLLVFNWRRQSQAHNKISFHRNEQTI